MKNIFNGYLGFTIKGLALALPAFAFALGAHNLERCDHLGSAQNMVAESDINTTGTYFDAITANGSSVTANGVLFNSPPNAGSPATDGKISVTYGDSRGKFGGDFSTSHGSASTAYSDAVSTGFFGENSNTVTISNLTIGNTYQVQSWTWWVGDNAPTTYTAGNTVALNDSIGQFAIGTFTAATATESYTYSATGGVHNFINAVSVRDTTAAAPEPAALSLLGVGSLALIRRRRRSA